MNSCNKIYETLRATNSLPGILSLLRSCLGPQTANWAILAGVFDITITFHYLLSPLRFYLWSDYTAHNPSILKCSLVYIVLTFKCDNQDIYCRLDDLVIYLFIGITPNISIRSFPFTFTNICNMTYSTTRFCIW